MRTNLLKDRAVSLRRSGKSYGQIQKALNIKSKGTLSYWFKDLELSSESKKLLRRNSELAQKRGLFKFNRRRSLNIEGENAQEFEKGRQSIRKISRYDLFLISVALYWGEGTKLCQKGKYTLEISNSDPKMIRVFLRFLREIIDVSDSKIRAGIYIHSNILPEEAKIYWSRVTGLPKERFFVVNITSASTKFKRPKQRLPNGTIKVTVNSRHLFYYMKGCIEGMSERTIPE